jgi:type I restriction enzyme R subunit
MDTNFSYIPAQWSIFAETAIEAEQQVYKAPLYTAMLCRKSLEEWVRWMYEHDEDLTLPYDTSLNTLIHQQQFKDLVAPSQFNQINLIRKMGNTAVHTNSKLKSTEALYCVQLLHGFIGWVVRIYSEGEIEVPEFNENLVPKESGKDKTKEELRKLETAFDAAQSELKKLTEELAEIKAIKDQNKEFIPPPHDPHEALTREIYINILLRESGWDPYGTNVPEYPVKGMPRVDGNESDGYVDYVLWGDDGLPLAVVEAKRTSRDPRVGQNQAKLYADCLEKEFSQRPVIFYTNGFETWIWDDTNYPPRRIFGFYTKDELQTLVNRRHLKKPLSSAEINNEIADRYYQKEAIRSVDGVLETGHREALLVMATGSGKTRVAAAIIDQLSKANWVKRVLFLADRNALIHQAKVNLNNYLPQLPAVDLTKEKEDESSRIVFSTYQTLINMIDGEFDEDDRFYSVGHFDLIIFDEIHRSVYNRYKHIFKYFDGIKLGLTATPKAEGDRDTYQLFELEPNNPTYAYELEQAVNDKFLVPPKAISVPIKFQRKGIKYAELNEEEKIKYEEEFTDPATGEYPEEIEAAALNQWLFNTDTVDKVIGHLMKNGIKVEGGDKLGKTIIFARSHLHAKFIEERFNIQYPIYKGEFLKVIDYHEEYKFDLLNGLKAKDKMPQIAVSVDMLDTGIDIPEVVNLVFFKPVRSSAKYWQMIGRGTRLCENLFGPDEDKKEFVIFDFCENFEFFGQYPKGIEPRKSKSLSQRLFELRLRLTQLLKEEEAEELKEYGISLLQLLILQVQSLNQDSFIVRQHWRIVEKYRDANQWNHLSDLDMKEIFDEIAPLVSESDQDELAKRFDAMMLDIQLFSLMGDKRQINIAGKIRDIAGKLSKKASIPSVAQKMDIIKEVQTKDYWTNISILGLERIRVELRDIIKFLEHESRVVVYSMFEDEFTADATEHTLVYNANNLEAYKRKVNQYLLENQHHLVIHKLKMNIPITKAELEDLEEMLFEQGELGTKNDFIKAFGEQPLGKFVRSIVGMDINAAKMAFGGLLANNSFNAKQIRFIDIIIDAFTNNGVVEPEMLFESAFTELHDAGISGFFDDATASKIIELVEHINQNAEAA